MQKPHIDLNLDVPAGDIGVGARENWLPIWRTI